ncbi:GatB/YqeY domain-containing protein [Hydrogenimonas cancrithermarum]|uniref:Aspartyl-tRNA amidotransferase subunit B n=1 Tax=Hydrogenimonas cancrithermarum TaxID=2993563 RepID=A0ABM8FIB2_9BACT|nr:GatB/YqeY domain-containing protein [Hydrogenimonas cancrithermarum]BDY12020.1 aspartyl-tRNA amidotransferase subunit B [Hydrogenimonas cancrithermarum]
MSQLKERLQADLKTAMKEKDSFKRGVIRFVMSAIKQIEVDERKELTDADIEAIIVKQIKQRNDAIEQFREGGREDLVEQNEKELEILRSYLPEPMSEDEVREILKEIIAETGAEGMKDMGKVMSAAKAKIGSRAEGKVINQIAKELLNR